MVIILFHFCPLAWGFFSAKIWRFRTNHKVWKLTQHESKMWRRAVKKHTKTGVKLKQKMFIHQHTKPRHSLKENYLARCPSHWERDTHDDDGKYNNRHSYLSTTIKSKPNNQSCECSDKTKMAAFVTLRCFHFPSLLNVLRGQQRHQNVFFLRNLFTKNSLYMMSIDYLLGIWIIPR